MGLGGYRVMSYDGMKREILGKKRRMRRGVGKND